MRILLTKIEPISIHRKWSNDQQLASQIFSSIKSKSEFIQSDWQSSNQEKMQLNLYSELEVLVVENLNEILVVGVAQISILHSHIYETEVNVQCISYTSWQMFILLKEVPQGKLLNLPREVRSETAWMKALWALWTTSLPRKEEAAIGPALQNVMPKPYW